MKAVLLWIAAIIAVGCGADNFDTFLRYYAMPLSAAAYSNATNICFKNIEAIVKSSITLSKQVTFKCDNALWDDTCSGYTAVDTINQNIIIAYRGTTNAGQLVTEAWDDVDLAKFLGGHVAIYFYNGFNATWIKGMRDDFLKLKNKYPTYNIVVTGHSLGGAMASIAAATIVSTNIVPASKVYLYTFGQPRTGYYDYAENFNKLGIVGYRVVHNKDIVAHLPALTLFENTDGYYHHVQEIWYENDMTDKDTYVVCDPKDGEDPKCSDSLYLNDSLDDHEIYYGREVHEWGYGGCPNDDIKSIKQAKNKIPSRPYRIQMTKKEKMTKKA